MHLPSKTAQLTGLFMLIEGSYLAGSRWAYWTMGSGVASELWRTGFRAAAALCLWLLFKKTLFSRNPESGFWRSPLALACLAFLLLAGLVPMSLSEPDALQWLFIATSLVVGIHEEFVFRGLLLNGLQQRIGTGRALLVTAFLFCGFHFGVMDWHVLSYLQILLCGLILSAVYLLSGSLWLVVLLHAGYDMACVMQFQMQPLDAFSLLGFLLLGTTAGMAALRQKSRRTRPLSR